MFRTVLTQKGIDVSSSRIVRMSDVADSIARTTRLACGCFADRCWLPCTCEDLQFSPSLKIVGRHLTSDDGLFFALAVRGNALLVPDAVDPTPRSWSRDQLSQSR